MELSLLLACAVVVEGSRTMVARGSGDGVWVVVAVDGCDDGGGEKFVCLANTAQDGVNCLGNG